MCIILRKNHGINVRALYDFREGYPCGTFEVFFSMMGRWLTFNDIDSFVLWCMREVCRQECRHLAHHHQRSLTRFTKESSHYL